ncbi:ABC transporter substrate-binding protein [Streptomyces malaysiensis]|uniref:ABC transporter substrate-binding protein n=1 Tax=Streptomyces malaysiensis TaxID=92644 RepID=UPI002B27E130|nr:extracellular solute-binding protein [Streptomyces malaysiensis]
MPGQRRPGRPVTGRRATAGTTALLTLLALVLAGCAGCSTHRAADTAGDGPVRLTFWSPLRGSQEVVDEFNKDIFTRNHIPVPKTWAEFESSARKLKQAQPRSRIASLFTTGGTLYLAGYAWQAGAQWYRTSDDTWHISMDDAPTRKVAAYWQRLMDNDLVRVEPGSSQQWRAHMQSGETAGYLAGAWAAGSMMSSTPGGKGKWAIAPMPQWDPAEPKVSTQGGSTFLVTKDSHHPEEAMEFISWMVTSPGALKAKLASGVSSAFPSVPGLVPVARKEMDTSYYSGQDRDGAAIGGRRRPAPQNRTTSAADRRRRSADPLHGAARRRVPDPRRLPASFAVPRASARG